MDNNTNINWYPGHMAKAKRLIEDDLKLIDVVIEVIDARIPISSRNPDLNKMVKNKKKIIDNFQFLIDMSFLVRENCVLASTENVLLTFSAIWEIPNPRKISKIMKLVL